MMMDELPIVIAYLGDQIPKHVYNSSTWIRFHAPKNPIHLICDRNAAGVEKFTKLNFKIDSTQDLAPLNRLSTEELKDKTNRWKYDHKLFWQLTAERLFWIDSWFENYKNSYKSFLHFESDCIPILNFNSLKTTIDSLEDSISFPRQNSAGGCASILIAKNKDSWTNFMNFMQTEFDPSRGTTDMRILSEANYKFPKDVIVLPRSPYSQSPVYFDPVTYGPFFLGYDARHHRYALSQKRRFEKDKTVENVRDYNFTFAMPSDEIEISAEGSVSKLFNLHVHNKLIPKCNWFGRKRLFIRLKYYKKLPDFRWDSKVFAERVMSKIATRISGRVKNIRLR